MSTQVRTRFAELVSTARAALWNARSQSGRFDQRAALLAATATSRAAGFLEAVTISDPLAARAMIDELESLVEDASTGNPQEAQAT